MTECRTDSVPRVQGFAIENETFLLREGTGNKNPLGPGPGEAAVATLLSFRYPQSSLSSQTLIKQAFSSRRAGDDGRNRIDHGGSPTSMTIRSEGMGSLGGREEDGEGLSICGAVFSLFLSVCPLLALGASSSPSLGGVEGKGAVYRKVALSAGELLKVRSFVYHLCYE